MAAPVLSPSTIRKDLVTRLVGKTAAGTHVYDSRDIDLDVDELPAIVVLEDKGSKTAKTSLNSLLFKRTERLVIKAATTAAEEDDLADAVDGLEDAILCALFEDLDWVGAFETVAIETDSKLVDASARRKIGAAILSVELTYHQTYTPSLTGMDLEKVRVTTDAPDPVGADVSARDIPIEVAE